MDSKNIPKFWSASLKEGQVQKITVPRNCRLNVTNACIQINNSKPTAPARFYALCSLHNKKLTTPALIASLYPQQVEQLSLKFRLSPGEVAELSAKGPHQIDLIGYLSPLDFEEEESDFEDDDSTEDEYSD